LVYLYDIIDPIGELEFEQEKEHEKATVWNSVDFYEHSVYVGGRISLRAYCKRGF
jgi:hypothetical protein